MCRLTSLTAPASLWPIRARAPLGWATLTSSRSRAGRVRRLTGPAGRRPSSASISAAAEAIGLVIDAEDRIHRHRRTGFLVPEANRRLTGQPAAAGDHDDRAGQPVPSHLPLHHRVDAGQAAGVQPDLLRPRVRQRLGGEQPGHRAGKQGQRGKCPRWRRGIMLFPPRIALSGEGLIPPGHRGQGRGQSGRLRSPAPIGRCISTTSSQRPNLMPADFMIPT